ncbi:MAG: sugar ABC transporter permease YjfF [Phenylobacterium sp.]|nr:MAG: sugar ABC transporter permease YjfF [Phenylobacterium sp.]
MNGRNLPLAATLAVFVAAYAVCAARFPAFIGTRVPADLVTDNAFLGVIAVGMAFVVISGGIDLSVGAVMGFSSVLISLAVSRWGVPPMAAFLLAVGLGTGFGAAIGAAIHGLRAPAFIVTLTAMFLARGAGFLLTTEAVPIDHPFFRTVQDLAIRLPGGGRLGAVSLVMAAAFLAGGVLLHATRFGNSVFAIGGDRRSAELMGVPVGRTTVLVYAISGGCAALAGVVISIYTRAGNPLTGVGVELDAIAAVVIGGALLSGGVGTMLGALVGVLIQGLILTYIDFDGSLSSWWSKIATGALLFAFIGLQKLIVQLPRLSPRMAGA